jgi:hypothetical protein
MDFKSVKPDERSSVIFLAALFALFVIWLTSYLIRAWKRGEIATPRSRYLSDIKTFSREESPITYWISFSIHVIIDVVLFMALLLVIYRLSL